MNPYYLQQLERVLRKHRVKMTTPIDAMPEAVVDTILFGTDREQTFETATVRSAKTSSLKTRTFPAGEANQDMTGC